MKQTYPDLCLERASKASEGPWEFRATKQSQDVDEGYFSYVRLSGKNGDRVLMADAGLISDLEFIVQARTDIEELGKRLKRACDALREAGCQGCDGYDGIADELESMPDYKKRSVEV
jgi:hypothetical protein